MKSPDITGPITVALMTETSYWSEFPNHSLFGLARPPCLNFPIRTLGFISNSKTEKEKKNREQHVACYKMDGNMYGVRHLFCR